MLLFFIFLHVCKWCSFYFIAWMRIDSVIRTAYTAFDFLIYLIYFESNLSKKFLFNTIKIIYYFYNGFSSNYIIDEAFQMKSVAYHAGL